MKVSLAAAMVLVSWAIAASAGGFTGSWSWRGPANSGGWLKTIQSGDRIRFQLELARGAPSYDSGFIEGEFELKNHTGIFRTEKYGSCEIRFTFQTEKVVLRTEPDRRECGFGHAVYADNIYVRDSLGQPVFSDGDPRLGE